MKRIQRRLVIVIFGQEKHDTNEENIFLTFPASDTFGRDLIFVLFG